MNLETFNMMTLVAIHNAISDKPASLKTFSQRSKAVDRINKIATEKGIKLSDLFDENGIAKPAKPTEAAKSTEAAKEPSEVTSGIASMFSQINSATKAKEPKAESRTASAPKDKAEKKEKKAKGSVIRHVAEGLLMEVITHDEDGRPYGHPYDVILAKIHEQFPEGKTSVACLRWYAVHMRDRGERVPNRPRVAPKKAD